MAGTRCKGRRLHHAVESKLFVCVWTWNYSLYFRVLFRLFQTFESSSLENISLTLISAEMFFFNVFCVCVFQVKIFKSNMSTPVKEIKMHFLVHFGDINFVICGTAEFSSTYLI